MQQTILFTGILIFSIFCISKSVCNNLNDKPNVVIIMADDLGFDDVSFHGNQMLTPNIDALGMHGTILNRFYVPPMCSPSRATLLTGKYPTHTGMQHFVIDCDEPWGLGLHEKIMPQFFKDAGYETHLVGKWHQGFFKKEYAPNSRGFDSFFGYLGPYIGYYDHGLENFKRNYTKGYDMRNGYSVSYETNGTYVTNLFTETAIHKIMAHDTTKPMFLMLNHLAPHAGNQDNPLEAPPDKLEQFTFILDEKRRYLAAMISVMDDGVGEVVQALYNKGILDNTIILFYSDNGAPSVGLHTNSGSNYPFRGQKNSPWEGGSRVPAVIWSSKILTNQVNHDFIHLSDVLPTLAEAAKFDLKEYTTQIDGISAWNALTSKSQKSGILRRRGYRAYMEDNWKVVIGTTSNGKYDGWIGNLYGETPLINQTEYLNSVKISKTNQYFSKLKNIQLTSELILKLKKLAEVRCNTNTISKCDPAGAPCLFNIINDPCELNNVATQQPEVLDFLLKQLLEYEKTMVQQRNKPFDLRANPLYHNNTWTYWLDEDYPKVMSPIWSLKIIAYIVIGVSSIIFLVIILFFYFLTRKHKKLVPISFIDEKGLNIQKYREHSIY